MKNKSADISASLRSTMKKVQEARKDYMAISEQTHPQETTQRIATWRNSIDSFHKDLDSHGKFLKSLLQDTPNVTIGTTKGVQKLLKISEKYANDFKILINVLKSLAFIPKNCEFSTWDLILQNLKNQLLAITKTVLMQGEEAGLESFIEICEIRDNLIGQILKALLYRKIVLWMDLDILDSGYVKGDILEAVQHLIGFKNKHGYLPTKVEYIHPKRATELPPINDPSYRPPAPISITNLLESFTDEFSSITSLIENNFQLKNTTQKASLKSPKVDSLRLQIEEVYREKEKLEEEIQKLRIQMRNPDKREWYQVQRDLEEKEQFIEHANKNIQKLNMEKFALETENLQMKQHAKQIENKLGKINEVYFPRLEEAEKLHSELSIEIKNIRQDAELLPGMFRNEAFMKKKIRDEKILTEERMNDALSNLGEEKTRFAILMEEKIRKDRIALQAVAARNSIEKELKFAQKTIDDLRNQIQNQVNNEDEMKNQVEMYKKRHDELQDHVYVQNNRINELEDQKKILIQQLKDSGNRSQAHYTYKPIKSSS